MIEVLAMYSPSVYLLVILCAFLGGLAKCARHPNRRYIRKPRTILIEFFMSLFTGLLTFFVCEAIGISSQWSIILVCLAGFNDRLLLKKLIDLISKE